MTGWLKYYIASDARILGDATPDELAGDYYAIGLMIEDLDKLILQHPNEHGLKRWQVALVRAREALSPHMHRGDVEVKNLERLLQEEAHQET